MKKRMLSVILVLAMTLCLFTACGSKDAGSSDPVSAKLKLVLEDGTEKSYDLNVSGGLTIREALFEAKLIDEETKFNFFIETIDGNTAAAADGVLWMFYDEKKNNISADEYKVKDGETITAEFTVAPNFDD